MKTPPGVMEVFLQPGDFYFGCADTRIRTLLGSCVSITLWHPKLYIGGMCHFMLPTRVRCSSNLQGKYADEAMELFQQQAEKYKTALCDYEIKLFGGGNMFPASMHRLKTSVSEKNIEAAERLLAQYNLHPKSSDLGGIGYRSIFFQVWSGNVWVKHQPLAELKRRK